LDKEKDFEKEYKHNIKIWRKQKIENEQNIKTLILKMKEDNEKFKEKIGLMKSLIEELKELRKVAKV
jgi:ribosome maturation factor RimP